MAMIICLPDEVITIIFSYNDISIEDIMNFRCVWEQFRLTAKSDKYWEIIFSRRWPSAKKVYDEQSKEYEQKESEKNERKDKKNFMETGINCARELRSYVSQIIHKHYYNESIDSYSNMTNYTIDNLIILQDVFDLDGHLNFFFEKIIVKSENFLKYSFFIDEFRNLLTQSPRRTGCDLTERYCNIKLFHYLRQCSVKRKWNIFRHQPPQNRLLEQKATMVAEWFQPKKDVFYSCVKASLNSIAVEVRNCLREKHPNHSIFLTSDETFSYWENNNIDDNHWNKAEAMQILNTLDECMFDKLNFQPSKLEDTNLEYMFIDNVLKNKYGHEVIIVIIYHSVARRLGLRCNIIHSRYDRHCIYWRPIYASNSRENERCFNISSEKFPDCFGNQLPFHEGFDLNSQLQRDTIFDKLVHPFPCVQYGAYTLMITRYGSLFRGNLQSSSINFLSLRAKRTALSRRLDNVKFAVGMIVTHDDQSTDSCTGVIVGWHSNVDRHFTLSTETKSYPSYHIQCETLQLNHCRDRPFINKQPNYIILTENNKMCYVEEDAITLTTPKWIDNSEIGRYFCKFEDTHYVPNKMLARLFPSEPRLRRYNRRYNR